MSGSQFFLLVSFVLIAPHLPVAFANVMSLLFILIALCLMVMERK
jgi:hypothetical protein